MPDITTDGLKQFVAAAKPLHLENGWADFDLEVAREACLQWMPLETCEAKKKVFKQFSSLLTVARFALQGSIDLEQYELPVPKAPLADFHPQLHFPHISGFDFVPPKMRRFQMKSRHVSSVHNFPHISACNFAPPQLRRYSVLAGICVDFI